MLKNSFDSTTVSLLDSSDGIAVLVRNHTYLYAERCSMLADICSTALASQRRWGQLRGKFSSYRTVYECKVILQSKVQSVLSNVVLVRFTRSEGPRASGNHSSMSHTAEPSSYPTRVCLSHCLLCVAPGLCCSLELAKDFLADCQLAQVKPCQETRQQLKQYGTPIEECSRLWAGPLNFPGVDFSLCMHHRTYKLYIARGLSCISIGSIAHV